MLQLTSRNEFKKSEKTGSSVIVGVQLATESEQGIDEDLDELASLLETLGVEVKSRITQKRQKLVAASLLGAGKIEEIKNIAEHHGADWIVFDHELSGPQVRNLEKMTGKIIKDRTGVILDIFAEHARTNESKTQVEIAKLGYELPRMTGKWTHFQRQAGGGLAARGMGEKQIEVDRRRAREKIVRLTKQLQTIRKEKYTQRKSRQSELRVALVGYTNSGKTTLMNALTKSTMYEKDELFATLDSSIRRIDPNSRPKILLSDTVGFIKKLPHTLVESFKSTLEEVIESDLLLIVVDVSHPRYEEHIETTNEVLEEIGASHVDKIMVFNKVDMLDDFILPKVLPKSYKGSIVVSAKNTGDVDRLRDHVYKFFSDNFIHFNLRVPHSDQKAISLIHTSCMILNSDYSGEQTVTFEVRASKSVAEKLSSYRIELD